MLAFSQKERRNLKCEVNSNNQLFATFCQQMGFSTYFPRLSGNLQDETVTMMVKKRGEDSCCRSFGEEHC